ncbi:MAG: helicase-related protein [Bauldia sp.]
MARGAARNENVVAVLGPTNTGKTHLAIERMLGHPTGVIGLPLRLLAREVYNKVAAQVGAGAVALITGEEKILPPAPRYRVCTVEALPSETDAAFLAIDEVQIAGDLERGHVFTDRLLNLRGRHETLLLGAATMRGILERLLPGISVITRPRMSVLAYTGPKKITRLPRRSAIVAFSAGEVYAIAELIRRQRGGAAVVLGALSPRTRNAQVEIFQSGDVEFLVATDAIGMGLNLDVDHVAFASDQKFDGYQHRRLSPAEFGQVAGRAGRHLRDGTFGVTARVDAFDDHLVEALENHRFEPVKAIQWRNRDLDFSSTAHLIDSLDTPPSRPELAKAPPSEDVVALSAAIRDPSIAALAVGSDRVALLWEVCQVPDYRRIAPANHVELITTLFAQLATGGTLNEDWFAAQIAHADNTEGDIDALANRIAHVRTWTFAANRPNWLRDAAHWQERTRNLEDRLSDALHERLLQRFVDRRTSVLMRRLRENAMPDAEVTPSGDVKVDGVLVGELKGFRFTPDAATASPDGKALRNAAHKALASEIERRAERVAAAADGDLVLAIDGSLRWQGEAIARLIAGDDQLRPRLIVLADDLLPPALREPVERRVQQWFATHAASLIQPLYDLLSAQDLPPLARGIAFRLAESLGVLDRGEVDADVRQLDQETRAGLRRLGVRFGSYHIYVPALLKPAPGRLLAMLWGLRNGGLDTPGIAELTQISASGRTTVPVDPAFPAALFRVVGYKVAGTRAIRIDILERLADFIRPLTMWRNVPDGPAAPPGAVGGGAFTTTPAMTSLLGCSGDELGSVLRALGYRMEKRPAPASKASPPKLETPPPSETSPTADAGLAPAPAASAAPDSSDIAAAPVETGPSSQPMAPTGEPLVAATVPGSTDQPVKPTDSMIEVWRRRRPDDGQHRANHRPDRRRAPRATTSLAPANDSNTVTAATGDPTETGGRRPTGPRRKGRGAQLAPAPRKDGSKKWTDSARPKADKPADPHSPFAALAALKAQLERGPAK